MDVYQNVLIFKYKNLGEKTQNAEKNSDCF